MVLVYPSASSDRSLELVRFFALLSLPATPLAFSPCVSERMDTRLACERVWGGGRPHRRKVVFLVVVLRTDPMDEVRIVKRPRAEGAFARLF